MNDQRIKELAKLPKWQLAQMHKRNGGLMPLATYQKWTKDELIKAVVEDEQWIRDDAELDLQSQP